MKELTKEQLLKAEKHNQKLYKYYKMISWDLLFFYAISFLFLHQTKGISTSEIIFADAFYTLFKLLFQLPATILIEKIGKKKSIMIANLSLSTYILIIMGLSTKYGLIFSNVFAAFGFIIKDIAQSNILFDSIRSSNNSHILFSKIDGRGSSLYYTFNAITSIGTGFLFVKNPYIPMILCLIFTIIAFLLSCYFVDISYINEKGLNINKKNTSIKNESKKYINDLAQNIKFILKSTRLRSLILFNSFFTTLILNINTLRQSLLEDIHIPDEYFGVLFAIWGLISAFSANSAPRIQKKYGNRTLSVLGFTFTISLLFTGLVSLLIDQPKAFLYFIVLCLISLQYTVKGPFFTLIERYLGSFFTSKMQTRISSITTFVENINRTMVGFGLSILTDKFSSDLSTLIVGIISTITLIILLKYMKTRVGLKLEQYPESDIKFVEIR